MRKTLLSASVFLLMSSSSVALANDFRVENPSLYNAGWEQKGGEQEMRSSVYLRSKLKRLEQENEELRNSLSQMRKGKVVKNDIQKDARIQALIAENNRLLNVLRTQKTAPALAKDKAADLYAHKLSELNSDIQRLTTELSHAKSDAEAEYEQELLSYRAENNRLRSSLNERSQYASDLLVKNDEIKSLQGTISTLEAENSELQNSLKDVKRAQNTAGQDSLQEIAELQLRVSKLTQENLKIKKDLKDTEHNADITLSQEKAELQVQLSSLRQENLKIKREMDKQTNQANQSLAQENAELQTKVSSLMQDNLKIKKELSDAKDSASASFNQDLVDLKKQNESLRQTITAQNDVLRAADNASQVAETMLSENAMLKKKLEHRKSAQSQNTQSAKTLIELNNKLQDEIAKRDKYIKKLEPLTQTVEALQEENKKLTFLSKQGGQSKVSTSMLRDKNESLEAALEKERANALEYRKKIKSYQEDIARLEKRNEKTTSLQLENQTLQAQVNLREEEVAVSKDVVKYIETSYPKVDKVKPVLNNDGSRIENDQLNDGIVPEDILSHSLKPLSDVK